MALFIDPSQPVLTAAGALAAGAKKYFYLTGTLTLTTVYTDAALSVPHTNPVIADASGRFPEIFVTAGVALRIKTTTSAGTTIDDVDPYIAPTSLSAGAGISIAGGVVSVLAEFIQDTVGALISASGSGLTVTYDDAGGTLTIALNTEAVQDIVGAFAAAGTGLTVTYNDAGNALTIAVDQTALKPPEYLILAPSDETTALTTGAAKVTFRMPYAYTVTAVRASLTTAQTSGNIFTVDINESGSSILSTKLTIDNGEKTSTTAATAAVISDASLADDAEITIDIDQIGDGTAKGLKVMLIGRRT